jgi:hypothetical protein
MIVKYITKDELRANWAFVKVGLEKVRDKGHNDWIVEDIYCDCYEQRSLLFICTNDDVNIGFMVMQPNGHSMHLWAAWLDNHQDLTEGLFHAKAIAKAGGYNKLTFTSARRGWDKKAKQLGFNPSTWEMKV